MLDRIPLPEDEPVVEDLLQVVGIVAFLAGLASALLLSVPPAITGTLLAGGALWYLVGAYLKLRRMRGRG